MKNERCDHYYITKIIYRKKSRKNNHLTMKGTKVFYLGIALAVLTIFSLAASEIYSNQFEGGYDSSAILKCLIFL